MIIEFQIRAERFLTLVRERAKIQRICYAGTNFLGVEGQVLDHLEMTADSSLQDTGTTTVTINLSGGGTKTLEDIKTFEVVQPVKIFTKTLTDLEDGNPPKELGFTPSFKLRFHIQLPSYQTPSPALCAELVPPPGAEDMEIPNLPCVSFDFTDIEDLLGNDLKVSNAGIAMESDGAFIALRFEIGTPASDASQAWSDFYAGEIVNRLQGNDWALFLDPDFIVPLIVKMVDDQLAGASDFNLASGPSGTWVGNPFSSVRVTFEGEKVDACKCAWGELDLDVAVTVDALFSASPTTPDELKTDVFVGYQTTDEAEAICCVITEALAGGVLGAVGLGKSFGAWAPVIGAVVGIIHAVVTLSGQDGVDLESEDCDQVSDTHAVCTQKVNLDLGGLGKLTLTSAAGVPDGLVLGGSMNIQERDYPGVLVSHKDFGWGYPDCHSSALVATAEVHLTPDKPVSSQWVPLFFCHAEVLKEENQAEQYGTKVISSGGHIEIHVTVNAFLEDYPCKLIIWTNLGVRFVQIEAPTPPSQQERLQMQIEHHIHCTELISEFWKHAAAVALKLTLPDPGPEEVVAVLWQGLIYGLGRNESAVFQDAAGRIMARAEANDRGLAQLSAFIPVGQRDAEVELIRESALALRITEQSPREGPHTARHRADTFSVEFGRVLAIKGVQLIREALLPLHGGGIQLSAGFFRGTPSLFLWKSNGLHVYDVSAPAFPRLIRQNLVQGLSGHVAWRGRILAWGGAGLALLSPDFDYLGEAVRDTRDEPVLDVAVTRSHLYVLDKSHVSIYNGQLEPVGRLTPERPAHMASVGNTLIVSNERGLELFDLTQATNPTRVGSFETEGIREILRPKAVQTRNTIFIRSPQGGGSILDLSRPGDIKAIMHFAEDPWFVGAAKAGRVLARLEKRQTALALYTAWRTFEDLSAVRTPLSTK